MTTAAEITEALTALADEKQRAVLTRFFKTAPGQYGEGDRFLGIKVPTVRAIVKDVRRQVSLSEIDRLIASPWHEARLCGFLLLVEEMYAALPRRRQPLTDGADCRREIADFYLAHARRANNWDLVDMSCPKILGKYLLYPQADGALPSRDILDRLAASDNLWEQRIGIVTNWMLIRHDEYTPTLRIATALLCHPHDLIHKATGWMLREVGKRDVTILEDYLDTHVAEMHRTTLRYAIEKLSPTRRQYWMKR